MTRTFTAGAVLITLIFCLQPAAAAEAPWCAVTQNSTESVYWDCQYRSFEDCYHRGGIWQAIVASAIQARTMSPMLQNTRAQRNAALARSSSR